MRELDAGKCPCPQLTKHSGRGRSQRAARSGWEVTVTRAWLAVVTHQTRQTRCMRDLLSKAWPSGTEA